MHGPRGGKGGEEEERAPRWHMWPVPSPGAAVAVSPRERSDSPKNSIDSFVKDGRKIHIGDCALFQAGNAPPFIGIIRWFETGKEDYPKLGVNWLYRPADLKLSKGSLLEAAPNEVFYSFHKDVIPAASLLHPCKVAFLRKGVELPAGISSFVCRRVYDIANRCLWWLTDQDYINERQEEVDLLLDKARLEMHASVQSGGRSPKPLNGPTSTQQLKSGSDSVQNSGTSFPSQVKRKRERGDQGAEHVKRERFTKTEDGDFGSSKYDSMLKAEIANITEKGGLVNTEGVEKLVHIIQHDKAERRIDLVGRILLADVIAVTDRFDCLSRFVQLRGVTVLDDWIQEAHKGKTGDGSSPKENDKAIDELLLTLLRALDKLPVNLNALQTCNIGKSVNNLRTHKNAEVQKKARSLVETWKKRVDAEIAKTNDAKTVGSSQAASWPVKQGFSEASHAGNRRSGSTEVTTKNAIAQQSPFKALASKPVGGDPPLKATAVTPGSSSTPTASPMAVGTNLKDSFHKASGGSGTLDFVLVAVKEEKSSNSSQSQNNSQSCSSDHVKSMGSSWKEDARSSTAGSRSASKSSGGSSRHRRSSNGSHGSNTSGVRKDINTAKSGSLNRAVNSDKVSESGLTCDRLLDTPADQVNGHRLIVRLPNPGRSPAQSTSAGSFEDPSIMGSRASSPGFPDKHDNSERQNRAKSDAYRAHLPADVNAESWQSNDVKEGPVGSDEGERDEDRSRNADVTGKKMDASGVVCSSSGVEKGVLLVDHKTRDSFSSINALIESCAKYSELSAPLTAGDDTGMNLLASVATGEMGQSDLVLPSASAQKASPIVEKPCAANNEAKPGSICDDATAEHHVRSEKIADIFEKNGIDVGSGLGKDEVEIPSTILDENKTAVPLEGSSGRTRIKNDQYAAFSAHFQKTAAASTICGEEREEERVGRCLPLSTASETKELDGDKCHQVQDKLKDNVHTFDSSVESKLKVGSPLLNEKESIDCIGERNEESNFCTLESVCSSFVSSCQNDNVCTDQKSEKLVVGESPSCPPADMDVQKLNSTHVQKLNDTDEVHNETALSEDLQASVVQKPAEPADKRGDVAFIYSVGDKIVDPVGVNVPATRKSDSLEVRSHLDFSDGERREQDVLAASSSDEHAEVAIIPPMVEKIPEKKDPEIVCSVRTSHDPSPAAPVSETERSAKTSGSRLSGSDVEGRDEPVSCTEASSLAITSGLYVATKRDFDLNEGISGNDVNQGEAVGSAAPGCSSATHVPIPSPFASSSMTNGLPVPVMVVAPAKGPFVPPENLLQNKGELRWKGSAATSAFRPAEPRRVLDMPLSAPDIISHHTIEAKSSRLPLDIDLNVTDDRLLEDMASQSFAQTAGSNLGIIVTRDAPACASGGLGLDLNIFDDPTENGESLAASSSHRLDAPLLPARPVLGVLSNRGSNSLRDFDLNNGPGLDEAVPETILWSQQAKVSNVPLLSPTAISKTNSAEMGNISSWFPANSSYPAVPMPTFLHDRREQPYPLVAAPGAQSILGPVNGSAIFGGDFYRGPVLSSSPAMAFSPAAAFPYAGFPFGSSFPLASTSFSGGSTMYIDSSSGRASTFPTVPSQLVSPVAGVSAHYPRPYVISLPESGTNSGSEGSSKWSRQGFDLNTGPGNDMEGKDDRFSLAARPFIVGGSQAFVEEQARLYNVAGGVLKRKEPEGGWDADRFAYKQPPWQ